MDSTRRSFERARRSLGEFPRQFWLLMAGVLVYVVGVDMCYPFETLYLHGGLHISMTAIGLVLGVAGLVTLPLQLVGGAIADRFGRRAVLALAVCASAVLYIGLALSHDLPEVVVVVTIEAAFGWAMFLTGSNAMVADLAGEARRAEAFSIVRTAINGSMVVGPLIALAFLSGTPDFRLLFAVGGGACLLFLIVIAGALRETRPAAAGRSPAAAGYARLLRDRRFLAFCAVSLLPFYGFGQVVSTFPVAMELSHGISAAQWARLLLAYALGMSLLQFPVVRLTRAWNPLLLLAGASVLVGLGLALGPILPWGWPSVALVLLVSLGVVVLIPVGSTVVAAFAPAELRGRYMGAWTITFLGGYALATLCGGYALDAIGPRAAFAVVGGAGLAGAACYLGLAALPGFRHLSAGAASHGGAPASSLETSLKPPVVDA